MIYLDNNATTRPDDSVVGAMVRTLKQTWGNPSSVHRFGQEARREVELARASVARLIGANPKSLTFTSGGTEALDLAIRGVLATTKKRVVVSTAVEHAAARDLLEALAKEGRIDLRLLELDAHGIVRVESAARLLDETNALVCVQWANNETGVVQPVEMIGARCRELGVMFLCDGVQWAGKEPVDVGEEHKGERKGWCDLLVISPHKFHGPKGVGVLWARPGVRLKPTLLGTQEGGRRGGTENVPGIIGAGAAAEAALDWLKDGSERRRLGLLRDHFERQVLAGAPGARVNAPALGRLWNTTNIAFPRLEAEALLLAFSERGLCASAGAACSSGSLDPSPVLLAMGVPPELAHGSIRFSLSKQTTTLEVDEAARIVTECVRRVAGSMA